MHTEKQNGVDCIRNGLISYWWQGMHINTYIIIIIDGIDFCILISNRQTMSIEIWIFRELDEWLGRRTVGINDTATCTDSLHIKDSLARNVPSCRLDTITTIKGFNWLRRMWEKKYMKTFHLKNLIYHCLFSMATPSQSRYLCELHTKNGKNKQKTRSNHTTIYFQLKFTQFILKADICTKWNELFVASEWKKR